MTSPRVKCSVDQCTHYLSGDHCQAAHVDIYNEASGNSVKASRSSGETQCKSFRQRGTVGEMVNSLRNLNLGGLMSGSSAKDEQVTPELACFVNTCTHWDANNHCQASEIQVNGPHAGTNEDTDCETFVPKDEK